MIDFSHEFIDLQVHTEWANNLRYDELKTQPYWGFDDLFYKAGTKLHNCFFMLAESKKIDRILHFHYQEIFVLKTLDIEKFINAIENGDVYIDFDARTGHNHGTKFRLKREALINLYAEVEQH